MTEFPFDPDYVIAPGATLQDWIDETGLPISHVARACKLEVKELAAVIHGKRWISTVIAAKLSQGTGIPARFWLALEHNYRVGLAAGKHDMTNPEPEATATVRMPVEEFDPTLGERPPTEYGPWMRGNAGNVGRTVTTWHPSLLIPGKWTPMVDWQDKR